jgi:hypothetical protein
MLKFISLKTKIIYEGFLRRGKGGLRAPETMSPSGVIKPKAMKNDKGREGVINSGKWADIVHGWPLMTKPQLR